MAKYSVNLILAKKNESDIFVKLKIIFPLVALGILLLFLLGFGLTVVYINANSHRFNQIKSEVSIYENKINSLKEVEGIYTLTSGRLNVLDQLMTGSFTFDKLLSEINDMNSPDIKISALSIDSKGNLNLHMTASSSAVLDDLVAIFISRQDKKLFSDIKAAGITRDKKGGYSLNINLNTNKTLLE